MDIRYSPYNGPFIPSNAPPGIHWIGLEHQNAPHSAHVQLYHQLLDSGTLEISLLSNVTTFFAGGHAFVSGLDRAGRSRVFWVSDAVARRVAVLVTPPLCPMGGTFRAKNEQFGIVKC